MISWLQTNLQKHFRILFIVLLGVIIVAFVFTIGAPGIGDGSRRERMANLKFFDVELDTAVKRDAFIGRAQISIYINQNPYAQQNLEGYAFNRATALYLANEHSVPGPNADELREFIQGLAAFQGQDGNFDLQRYNSFLDEIDTSPNQSRSDISEVIEEEFRIQKVYDILSGPSFVDADEVLDSIKQEQTEWSIKVAAFNFDSYETEVEVTDENLQDFYQNARENYATPARRSISYIEFKALDYQSKVTFEESDLKDYFERNASNYEKAQSIPEAAAADAAAVELPDFDEVKAQVEFDYKLEQAKILAQEAAQTLVLDIVENDIPSKSDAFQQLLSQYDATTRTLPPFAENETPIGTSWSRNAINTAYRLTESRYYSDPLLEGDSALVLFLDNEIARDYPALESIRGTVEADFKAAELRKLQIARGEEIQSELAAADDFESAASSLSLDVKSYDKFTRASPAEGLDRSLTYSLDTLSQGSVSDMITRGDVGNIIYVSEKSVPELNPEGEEFDSRIETMKTLYERYVVTQYISDLAEKEMLRAGLASSNS